MEVRNAQYNARGDIDCELLLGSEWVPFTASSTDGEATGRQLFETLDSDSTTAAYVAPDPEPEPTTAELLADERSGMAVSPLQGILTLGETEWGKVLAYRETATWQERVIIDNASDWVRTSQNIAFFGYLLGYTPEQMDTLFIAAAQVKA